MCPSIRESWLNQILFGETRRPLMSETFKECVRWEIRFRQRTPLSECIHASQTKSFIRKYAENGVVCFVQLFTHITTYHTTPIHISKLLFDAVTARLQFSFIQSSRSFRVHILAISRSLLERNLKMCCQLQLSHDEQNRCQH